jgi:hypothetical protein
MHNCFNGLKNSTNNVIAGFSIENRTRDIQNICYGLVPFDFVSAIV